MAYSYAVQVFGSTSNQIQVTFPFLARDHVSVKIDGVDLPASGYSWLSDGLIQTNISYPTGTVTRVWRTTPIDDPLVVFDPGFVDPKDLNDNTLQLLYATQESLDEAGAASDISGDILGYYENMVLLSNQATLQQASMITTYNSFLALVSQGAALHIDITIPNAAYAAASMPTNPIVLMAFISPFNALTASQSLTNWKGLTTDDTHVDTTFTVREYDPTANALSAAVATLFFAANQRTGTWSITPAAITKNKLYVLVCDTAGNNMSDLYGSIELIPAAA
jgi:hypothetical protein